MDRTCLPSGEGEQSVPRLTILHGALMVALVGMTAAGPVAAAQPAPKERYIVVLRDDVVDPGSVAETLSRGNGLEVGQVYRHALKGFAAKIPAAAVAGLSRNPRVAFIEPDQPIEAAAELATGVNRIEAYANFIARIDGTDTRVDVGVAVLDSGVAINHPALNVVDGTDCTGVGYYDDDNGHGTHVAGIIGAIDNGQGVVGVAPGAPISSVKVLDRDGSGTWSSLICGIDWVTARADTIAVANLSVSYEYGTDATFGSTSLHRAICASVAAGVTYTVAAGNSARDAGYSVPGQYEEVITVSAMADSDGQPGGRGPATSYGADDARATFSNYGTVVDLAAPGVGIYSTVPGGYKYMDGTSMATPHVTGAAALYIARNGRVSPAAVKAGLQANRERIALAGDPDGKREGVVNVRDGKMATVTSDLRLRSLPSLSASVKTVMPEGSRVAITGAVQNGFYPVSFGNLTGWASRDYLALDTVAPPPPPAEEPAPSGQTATVTADLNLRSGPGTGYSVITVMPSGSTVTLTGDRSNGFAAVDYKGTKGWAFETYLSSGTSSPPPATNTATVTDALNLRSGPGTSYSVLLVMPAGSTVTLTGNRSNGFVSVDYKGTKGWASEAYLR